jgi:arylsulfatase A-like enzyme
MPFSTTLPIAALRVLAASILLCSCMMLHAQRPNIIYIMTDDMGYGDLGSYGQKAYPTPNLDRLAMAGITLTHAYAAAPVCTPTRTAFMTGRYPARTPVGLIEPLTSTPRDSAIGLTTAYPSVATALQDAGYETALIGKWHLGTGPQHKPTANGFDYFYGILSGAADYIAYKNQSPTRDHDLYENTTPVHPTGYLTDLLTEKAVTFIRQDHPSPFFLALTYNAPHWPW